MKSAIETAFAGGKKMFGFIGSIGPWELVLILLIALIVFGPGKLPEVAKGLGKAVNQFKNASSGLQKEFEEAIKDSGEKPAQTKKEIQSDPPIQSMNAEQNETVRENENGSKPE